MYPSILPLRGNSGRADQENILNNLKCTGSAVDIPKAVAALAARMCV